MKKDQGRIEKASQRYHRAAHRVQTAITFNPDRQATTPNHLRVGVDMSKADMAGLVKLLIDKGLFTEEEYLEAVAASAEQEADTMEDDLSAKYGVNLKTF